MNQITSLDVSDCPNLYQLAIYFNNIKAGNMGQIVNALPTWNEDNYGALFAFVDPDYDEEIIDGNVITTSQVQQANSKYWNVYWWNVEEEGWTTYAGSAFILGDVNDDGFVTIADVTILIGMVLSGNASASDCPAGDLNNDGDLNIADVTILISMVLRGNSGSTLKAAPKQKAASISPDTLMMPLKDLSMELPRKHPQKSL
jgi:hypothetical protein